MIGERLDDAALAEPAVRTLAHALQFAPQRFQARDLAFDLGKLMRGDTVRRGARRFGWAERRSSSLMSPTAPSPTAP